MNKKLILILCAVLVFVLAAVLAFYFLVLNKADDVSIEYDIVTVGEPDRNSDGEIIGDCHYQLLVFSDPNDALARINDALEAACDDFMYTDEDDESECERDQYLYSLENSPYSEYLPSQPYLCTTDIVDVYINDAFVSVKLQFDWSCGGVHNREYYGMNFDINTGKAIDVYDLFPSKRTAERKIIRATLKLINESIEEKGYSGFYDDVEDIVKNYDFSEIDFYYDGKSVFVFYPTYYLGAGATGCITVEIPLN